MYGAQLIGQILSVHLRHSVVDLGVDIPRLEAHDVIGHFDEVVGEALGSLLQIPGFPGVQGLTPCVTNAEKVVFDLGLFPDYVILK